MPPPSEAPLRLGYHTSYDYAAEDNATLHRIKVINDDLLALTTTVMEEDALIPYDDAIEDDKLHFPMIMAMAATLLHPTIRPKIIQHILYRGTALMNSIHFFRCRLSTTMFSRFRRGRSRLNFQLYAETHDQKLSTLIVILSLGTHSPHFIYAHSVPNSHGSECR